MFTIIVHLIVYFLFFYFLDRNGMSYLFNIEFIQQHYNPAVGHIVYYSQDWPNPLQNNGIQNWDRYYKQTEDVIGGFFALLVHPRIRLLHGIYDVPAALHLPFLLHEAPAIIY